MLKVLLRNGVISPMKGTLKLAPKALNGVRVDLADGIFLKGVLNRLMLVELFHIPK